VISGGLSEGERVVVTDVLPVIDGLPPKPIHAKAEEIQLAIDALGKTGKATDNADGETE